MEFKINVDTSMVSIPAEDYNSDTYPSSGLYYKATGVNPEWYFFVSKGQKVVYGIPKAVFEVTAVPLKEQTASTNIDDILKVIAITQNPELIKDKL